MSSCLAAIATGRRQPEQPLQLTHANWPSSSPQLPNSSLGLPELAAEPEKGLRHRCAARLDYWMGFVQLIRLEQLLLVAETYLK